MSEAGWVALPPARDDEAATILADCPALGSPDSAKAAIAQARAHPDTELLGWIEGDALIAVYGLRRDRLSFALLWLAVREDRRAQRYGRSALVDALRRCGRKPMTVEVDESTKGWFERVGFKTVGRKPQPAGGYRYRLGWYAPRRPDEPGYGAH
jgi:hypothetical protein